MKILVTGGTGFIGSHLTKELRKIYDNFEDEVYTVGRTRVNGHASQGYYFHVPIGHDTMGHCQKDTMHITTDLSDRESVCKMMKTFKPDMVYHLAANPITKMDEDNPFQIMHDNIMATHYLCEYAPQGCRFIFASSIVVYGTTDNTSMDMTISEPDESCNIQPTSLYGVSKHASEGIVNVYTQLGRIKGTSLRLCATVGSGVTHGVLYDFVRKLQSDSPELELLGDEPGSCKPYIHVDDVVNAFVMCDCEGVFNICADNNINICQIADLVKLATKISKPNKWLGSEANWKGDNPVLMASNEKALDHFWDRTLWTSEEAIIQAVYDIMETQ